MMKWGIGLDLEGLNLMLLTYLALGDCSGWAFVTRWRKNCQPSWCLLIHMQVPAGGGHTSEVCANFLTTSPEKNITTIIKSCDDEQWRKSFVRESYEWYGRSRTHLQPRCKWAHNEPMKSCRSWKFTITHVHFCKVLALHMRIDCINTWWCWRRNTYIPKLFFKIWAIALLETFSCSLRWFWWNTDFEFQKDPTCGNKICMVRCCSFPFVYHAAIEQLSKALIPLRQGVLLHYIVLYNISIASLCFICDFDLADSSILVSWAWADFEPSTSWILAQFCAK